MTGLFHRVAKWTFGPYRVAKWTFGLFTAIVRAFYLYRAEKMVLRRLEDLPQP